MACFLVPAAEAVVVTMIGTNVKKREAANIALDHSTARSKGQPETGISWGRKLSWLTNLLWGGVFLLAIEHIWHGEVVPWPPFLTAMNHPEDIAPMLHEIATVGVSMAVFVTATWFVMILVADRICKKTFVWKQAAQEE
ncbi:MAG: hypothetical protein AB7E30_07920 [Lawsonibacter sp.]